MVRSGQMLVLCPHHHRPTMHVSACGWRVWMWVCRCECGRLMPMQQQQQHRRSISGVNMRAHCMRSYIDCTQFDESVEPISDADDIYIYMPLFVCVCILGSTHTAAGKYSQVVPPALHPSHQATHAHKPRTSKHVRCAVFDTLHIHTLLLICGGA